MAVLFLASSFLLVTCTMRGTRCSGGGWWSGIGRDGSGGDWVTNSTGAGGGGGNTHDDERGFFY